MFILDTNIIIYHNNGDRKVSDFILQTLRQPERLCVATISLVEFLSYPELRKNEKDFFVNLLGQLIVISLDYRHALTAAEIKRNYQLNLPDSIIAATAILGGGVLVSRDKEFKKIKEIEVIDL